MKVCLLLCKNSLTYQKQKAIRRKIGEPLKDQTLKDKICN